MMNDRHHLRLFGIPALLGADNAPVRIRTRKQLALLIYLALEGNRESLGRATLANLFWPKSEEARARHSLRQALTELRHHLGADSIEADMNGIRLAIPLTNDFDAELLSQRVPDNVSIPLEGVEDWAGAELADWVEAKRERILRHVRSRLKEELIVARSEGNVDAVRERAEQLYNVDPYNDSAMQALVADRLTADDRSGALWLFRRHVHHCQADLGRKPSNDVLASLERIENGLFRDVGAEGGGGSTQPSAESQPSLPFGREAAVRRLEASLTHAMNGESQACLIRGGVGSGKTTLLKYFLASIAPRNVPAYLVSCQEIGRCIPFAALSALFDQMLVDPSLGGTDSMWLSEASRIAPSIRATYPGVPVPDDTPPDAVRIRLAESASRMLETLADGRLACIAFDDAHYLDPASRDVIHLAAQRLKDAPALILVATHWTESDNAAPDAGAPDGFEPNEVITLGPLTDEVIERLVTTLAGEEEVSEVMLRRIVEYANGNPQLAAVLVADWRHHDQGLDWLPGNWYEPKDRKGQVSNDLTNAVRRRFRDLSDNENRILELLAVARRSLQMHQLSRILGLDQASINCAALRLTERSIVRSDEGSLSLSNALKGDLIYRAAMSEDKRRFYHSALTDYLEGSVSFQGFQAELEASHHASRARRYGDAVRLVCSGAARAIESGAPKEAEAALDTVALEWPEKRNASVGLLRSRAASAQGAFSRALDTADSIAEYSLSDKQRAELAYIRAEALHRGRFAAEASRMLMATETAMRAALDVDDYCLAMKTQQIAAEIAYESGRWDALEIIESECTGAAVGQHGLEVGGLADLILGFCRLVSGEPTAAWHFFSKAEEVFREIKLDSKLYRSLNGKGMSASSIGSYDKAIAAFKAAAATARRSGDMVANANANVNLGSLFNDLGQFSVAAEHFRKAMELESAFSASRVTTALYCNAANLSISIGNFPEATELIRIAEDAAVRSGLWHHRTAVFMTRADLLLAEGHEDEAMQCVSEVLEQTGDRYRLVPDLGQYWRLRRLYNLTTGEGDATSIENPSMITLAHQLELKAFEQWYGCKTSSTTPKASAFQQLAQLRLFGVIARLAAVGFRNPLVRVDSARMSGADWVARSYPEVDMNCIPRSVRA